MSPSLSTVPSHHSLVVGPAERDNQAVIRQPTKSLAPVISKRMRIAVTGACAAPNLGGRQNQARELFV